MNLNEIGAKAKKASYLMAGLGISSKNEGLMAVCDALTDEKNIDRMLLANDTDIKNAIAANMKESLVDRLRLTKDRIHGMAEGIRQIISLDDPVGEVINMKPRPNSTPYW